MLAAIIFVGSIVTFVIAIAAVAWLGTFAFWVRDGRPQFTRSEQDCIDRMRAQGRTLIGARRAVLKLRQSPFASSVAAIRNTGGLIENPASEVELRRVVASLDLHSDQQT